MPAIKPPSATPIASRIEVLPVPLLPMIKLNRLSNLNSAFEIPLKLYI